MNPLFLFANYNANLYLFVLFGQYQIVNNHIINDNVHKQIVNNLFDFNFIYFLHYFFVIS